MKGFNSLPAALFVLLVITAHLSSAQKLVLVGGGLADNNAEVYNTFIDLATPARGSPRIGIITAASATAQENGEYYVNLFKNTYNVDQVEWLPIYKNHEDAAYNETLAAEIESSFTGIFFGGGDQNVLVQCLTTSQNKDTPVLAAIRTRFEAEELVVGGTSAGCVANQATPMVLGGVSYDALLYGAYDTFDDLYPDDLVYAPRGGLGFFWDAYLDSHFAVRGRQGRFIQLVGQLLEEGVSYIDKGFGIDENTALVVEGTKARVIGETGMYVIDMQQAASNARSKAANSKLLWQNVIVSYLTKDDEINLLNYEITIADWKTNIKGHELHRLPMSPTNNIFSATLSMANGRVADEETPVRRSLALQDNPREFTIVSTDLYDCSDATSTYGTTLQDNPLIRVNMIKTGDGYYGTNEDGDEMISYVGLTVDVLEY